MTIILFILLVVITILIEVPKLIREHSYKELGVFSIILGIGIYLGMVQLFEWPLYNPIPQLAIMLDVC